MRSPRRCSRPRPRPGAAPPQNPRRALSVLAPALALLLVLAPAWTAAAGPTPPRGVDAWSAWISSYLAAAFGGTGGLSHATGATGATRDPDGSPQPLPGTGTLRDPDGSPVSSRVFAGAGPSRDPNGDPQPASGTFRDPDGTPAAVYAGSGAYRDPSGSPLAGSGTYRDPDGAPLPGSEDGGWIDPDG